MRERFCRVCREWHDVEAWPEGCFKAPTVNRSELSAPMLALDTMKPVQSMLDGKIYDSKSALRATYKQAGMVEVGNDSSDTNPKPPQTQKVKREDVQKSVGKAFSRAGLGA